MKEVVADIQADRMLLAEIKDGYLSQPEIIPRSDDHLLIWICSVISEREPDIAAISARGSVSGGCLYLGDYGTLDVFDSLQQLGIDALLVGTGQAVASAARDQEALLAFHIEDETAVGICQPEEVYTGSRNLAGSLQLPGLGRLKEGVVDAEAYQNLAEELLPRVQDLILLLDPLKIVFSGRESLPLENHLFPLLRQQLEASPWENIELQISPWGSYAALIGAARLLAPQIKIFKPEDLPG